MGQNLEVGSHPILQERDEGTDEDLEAQQKCRRGIQSQNWRVMVKCARCQRLPGTDHKNLVDGRLLVTQRMKETGDLQEHRVWHMLSQRNRLNPSGKQLEFSRKAKTRVERLQPRLIHNLINMNGVVPGEYLRLKMRQFLGQAKKRVCSEEDSGKEVRQTARYGMPRGKAS